MENVSFTYPAASGPALREVSLEIEAGQVIALVGENGSGKTTLAELPSRLHLPAAADARSSRSWKFRKSRNGSAVVSPGLQRSS